MLMVAAEAPELTSTLAGRRAARAQSWPEPPQRCEVKAARRRLSELMAPVRQERQAN
jgi:hypothetical protein